MSDQPTNDAHAEIQDPPQSLGGILRKIGPGLILAGSIVGSGELIATTATGAEAGFSLLWLIIIGCVIKVFVQIELGRYTMTSGQTTLVALNSVPGPRFGIPIGGRKIGANWIVWFWVIMFMASIAQLGGIVGGVGQALSISVPLTETGKAYNEARENAIQLQVAQAQFDILKQNVSHTNAEQLEDLQEKITSLTAVQVEDPEKSHDDKIWAAIIGIGTVFLLVTGKYGLIEIFSTVFVGAFTLITIGNVFALQGYEAWAVKGTELIEGLSFGLPEASEGKQPLATALMTFGIIGVGAAELVAYPYWCMEKGYAKWTGKHDKSEAWGHRAKGWMHVMHWDAWSSMVLYTISTIAFYLLGAAILSRIGLVPAGTDMIRTLGVMYEPVFGGHAQFLFLFGAFAVLYSTFFVANAAHTRTATDIIPAFNIKQINETERRKYIRICGAIWPLMCVLIYIAIPAPVVLVLLSGLMQALLLPMLGVAALYYRYKQCDERLKPNMVWDIMLWISFVGFLIVGVYLTLHKLEVV